MSAPSNRSLSTGAQAMEVGGPAFAKFEDLVRLAAMEVYGETTKGLRKRLLDKARMLGGSDEVVTFHSQQAGFAR